MLFLAVLFIIILLINSVTGNLKNLKRYLSVLLFMAAGNLQAQHCISALRIDTCLYKIELLNKIGSKNIYQDVPVDSLERLYSFLYLDSLNYQLQVKPEVLQHLDFMKHDLVNVLIHHDSNFIIDRTVYLFKISNSSILTEMNGLIGKCDFFGSLSKKVLSNGEIVEGIYFWDYSNQGEIVLIFFPQYKIKEVFPDLQTDLAMIMIYKRKTRQQNATTEK